MKMLLKSLIVFACSMLFFGTGDGKSMVSAQQEGDMHGKAEQRYIFFDAGNPGCRLVLPTNPAQEEQEAAELIREIFKKMGGGEAAIVNEATAAADAFNGVDVHAGRTDFANSLSLLPPDMDADGFVIYPADAGRLVLLGGRPVSTLYAATELLERYAGILWVWPGEHGTVIPQSARLEATVQHQLSEPAFLSRYYFGMSDANMAYYRIHRGSEHSPSPGDIRINFHHNIRFVMPSGYYASHPEWFNYSRWHGKRMDPGGSIIHWQACTTNPEVIQFFIDAAKQLFASQPWVRSFSVSQNDGGGWCECDNCIALDVPGVSGVSDRYFTFVNAVADGIRQEYPDRYIACFAYSSTVNPPVRVKLRPNVLPVLVIPTVDHHRSVIEWGKQSSALGAYFWLHGNAAPKFYPHRWAEYLRFLRSHNVIHVNAEFYQDRPSDWASWDLDGPRAWITSKLLWNPDADIDALMELFCTRFYGPAAEPMLRYYRQCEMAWERREDPFDFGRDCNSQQFDIYNSADMDVMQECIEQALALAAADAVVTARLSALERRLSPVAGYVCQLELVNTLESIGLNSLADAQAVVARVHEVELVERELTQKGLSLFGTLLHNTEMAIDSCFYRITQLLGDEAPAFWRKVTGTRPELKRFVSLQLLDISDTMADNAVMPMSLIFNEPADPELEWLPFHRVPHISGDVNLGWDHWIGEAGGTVGIATKVARTGSRSLVITDAVSASGIYTFRVNPGERYRVSVWAKTSVQPEGEAKNPVGGSFVLRYLGPHGWAWNLEVRVELPAGTSEWTHLSSIVTVPLNMPRLGILLSGESQTGGKQTWFDDLCIEQL